MSLLGASLLISLLMIQVDADTGVHFLMNRHTGDYFCGQLQCEADFTHFGSEISSLVEMSIYDITRVHTGLRLASVSTFHPELYVDTAKSGPMSSTGAISRHEAKLTVQLRHDTDCLYGIYKCQLNLVTASGHSEVLTEIVTPEQSSNCSRIALLEELLTARVNNLTIENTALEGKVTQLSVEKLDLQTRLENATQRIAELEALVNASIDKPQVLGTTCYKGMPLTTSRQEFLLWGRVPALCDTETDGGGWVVIQRRTQRDVNFTRNWADYKNGFGTPDTDFWIGLDAIHNLTTQGYSELRLEYVTGGTRYYGQYSSVSVASESVKYRISASGFRGSAGDCFTSGDSNDAHNNMYFSTSDSDNDKSGRGNCAKYWKGGWWYNSCYHCNFNGIFGHGMAVRFNGNFQYLSFSEMKLRRG